MRRLYYILRLTTLGKVIPFWYQSLYVARWVAQALTLGPILEGLGKFSTSNPSMKPLWTLAVVFVPVTQEPPVNAKLATEAELVAAKARRFRYPGFDGDVGGALAFNYGHSAIIGVKEGKYSLATQGLHPEGGDIEVNAYVMDTGH